MPRGLPRGFFTPFGSNTPELAPAWFENVGATLLATRSPSIASKLAPTKPNLVTWWNASGLAPGIFTDHGIPVYVSGLRGNVTATLTAQGYTIANEH